MIITIEKETWEALECTPNVWCAHCNLVWFEEFRELRNMDTCKCGNRTYDWNALCELMDENKARVEPRLLSSTGLMFR